MDHLLGTADYMTGSQGIISQDYPFWQ